jgi:hypothetical protein
VDYGLEVVKGYRWSGGQANDLSVVTFPKIWLKWRGELDKEGWTEMQISVEDPDFTNAVWQPIEKGEFLFDTRLGKDYGQHTLYGKLRKPDDQGGWIELEEVVSTPWFYNGWYIKEITATNTAVLDENSEFSGYVKTRIYIELDWEFRDYLYNPVFVFGSLNCPSLGLYNKLLMFKFDFSFVRPDYTLNLIYENEYYRFVGTQGFSPTIDDIQITFGEDYANTFTIDSLGFGSIYYPEEWLTDPALKEYFGL